MSQFFPHEVAAGTFHGAPFAVPWFDNPEGLYYWTDLIKTPPTASRRAGRSGSGDQERRRCDALRPGG